jgi:23S rRNA pseudouridine1911/1915/1917 synthase
VTTHVVEPADEGLRLDHFLRAKIPERSRALIQKHIDAGAVLVGGAAPKRGSSTKLALGDVVTYQPPPPEPVDVVAEDIPLSVLFEDEHVLVVDKQAGLVVHPALGHRTGTLVNAVLHHVRTMHATPENSRPGIVHRLDRDTTGVIVIAKNEAAHDSIARAFRDRKVTKQYVAVTVGVPKASPGRIDTKYGRDLRDRKKFSSKVVSGKRAITRYVVSERYPGAALVDITLETGRTHQIRVHFCDMGHPLVGDRVYGRRGSVKDPKNSEVIADLDRPALHARRLVFPHPVTGEPVDISAPIPADLAALIDTLRRARDRVT